MSEKGAVYEDGRATPDAGRHGPVLQTWLGIKFYPMDPRPAEVDILDIAFALGNIARYNGHCRFYSVAEHSVHVSRMVPEHLALDGLMHDAAEAYVGDVTRPMKRALESMGNDLRSFYTIERGVRTAIAAAFGLRHNAVHEDVLKADNEIVAIEKLRLHPRSCAWALPVTSKEVLIECLPPQGATLAFLRRFCELTGEEYGVLEEIYHYHAGQDEIALARGRMVR